MVFFIVGRCRRKWKWIGRARKLCRSRWDHVEIFSRRLVITTSGLVDFYFQQEKSAVESLAWLHWTWKRGQYLSDFSICGTPNTSYAWNQFSPSGVSFVSHRNLRTLTDIGKILLGFCSQYMSRKCHGSVPKNCKQYQIPDKLPPSPHLQ